MVAITEEDIRELAGYRGQGALVTSCYLNVDGARHIRHQDVVRELDRVLRPARARCNGDQSVAADLGRIEAHVRGGFDRSGTRGLAIFSCSADDYWRVVELPVPVRSQVVVNHTPTVRQLETVVDQHERFGLLLVDRQRARMFVFELGEVVESTGRFDRLPRGDDDDHSFTKDQARDHAAAVVHQHLRQSAEAAFAVFQDQAFERLVIGAPDDLFTELESVLHPYLRERLVARSAIAPGASDDEVRRAAREIEADVERAKERCGRVGRHPHGPRGAPGRDPAGLGRLRRARLALPGL
jgi:peptide chain release factor subunit 1